MRSGRGLIILSVVLILGVVTLLMTLAYRFWTRKRG